MNLRPQTAPMLAAAVGLCLVVALSACAPSAAGGAGWSPVTGPSGAVSGLVGGVGSGAPATPGGGSAGVGNLRSSPTGGPGASVSSDPSVGPVASATVAPSLAPSRTPKPSASPRGLVPPPRPGPFAMDLYHRGDFVTELRKIWCAPAAMQTMINVMSRGADTRSATQTLLQRISRKLGPSPDGGAEPEGVARTLTSLGYGRWQVLAEPTRAAAVKAAARAIRMTGRPVDLLVWRGAHNWVVSGFTATADPALGDDFTVTALRIEDVWYPRISTIWGASRPPDALVPVGRLHEDYLPWRRPSGHYPGKDGRFVLVIPIAGR